MDDLGKTDNFFNQTLEELENVRKYLHALHRSSPKRVGGDYLRQLNKLVAVTDSQLFENIVTRKYRYEEFIVTRVSSSLVRNLKYFDILLAITWEEACFGYDHVWIHKVASAAQGFPLDENWFRLHIVKEVFYLT